MQTLSQRDLLDVNPLPGTGAVTGTRKALWTGRLMSGLAILFLAFDAMGKVLQLPPFVQGTTELGFSAGAVLWLGLIQVACLALYVLPRTSVLGAILLTGWFGGAIATHVRMGNPLFSHTLFPVYVAVLVWVGLCLRNGRVRDLLLLRVRG